MTKERAPSRISLRRAWRALAAEHGASLLEYALVVVLLMTFIYGIMDFSRFMYIYHFVSDVAREGTRYAAVRGSTWGTTSCSTTTTYSCAATAANVTTYVQSLTPMGINSGSVSVAATWPGTAPKNAATACNTATGTQGLDNSPGCNVQVVVTYPFHFMFPMLPNSATAYTITSTSVMVISQ